MSILQKQLKNIMVMNPNINGAQLKTIPLERINRYDTRFSITFPVQIESLVNSFRAVGQLYPLIVKQEGELYSIVDGFRRVEAAAALDFKEIEVKILPDSANTTLDYYLFHLYSIITTRPLSEIEKAAFINRLLLEHAIPVEEIKKKYCPLINFTLFPHYQEICEIVAGLPDELKMYLHKKNIPLQNLVNFWNMDNQRNHRSSNYRREFTIRGE
ncbi:MAG: ParB/RepB/Spo0J family partition protein [Patescibacteria group bacterium]|nr:ParB/RepB/Spo0J family partition protein [Patescibacteria group bacterium]